jgi:hypothetical protein
MDGEGQSPRRTQPFSPLDRVSGARKPTLYHPGLVHSRRGLPKTIGISLPRSPTAISGKRWGNPEGRASSPAGRPPDRGYLPFQAGLISPGCIDSHPSNASSCQLIEKMNYHAAQNAMMVQVCRRRPTPRRFVQTQRSSPTRTLHERGSAFRLLPFSALTNFRADEDAIYGLGFSGGWVWRREQCQN